MVKFYVSDSGRLFNLMIGREEAFMGSSKLPRRSTKMRPRMQKQIAKSREQALAAFVSKKARSTRCLLELQALSDDHFGYGPDEITWDHVGTLGYYAELLKRVTDSAFKEGEHAE